MIPAPPVRIETAAEEHIPLLLNFIRKLAEYEKLAHEVALTEAALHDALFGKNPVAEALVAFVGAEPAGYALYFQTFSTFRGRPGIYLEDLFVEPVHRRYGIGTKLLAAVAKIAHECGGQLNWSVLKWNQPAIDFYKQLGATEVESWSGWKLKDEALGRLARQAR